MANPCVHTDFCPVGDLWRLAKAFMAANRVYATVQEHAKRAVAWLDALSPYERLLQAGLLGTMFSVANHLACRPLSTHRTGQRALRDGVSRRVSSCRCDGTITLDIVVY